MKKYKDEALEALHDLVIGLHKAGIFSDERMRDFEEDCLVKPAARPARRTAVALGGTDAAVAMPPLGGLEF